MFPFVIFHFSDSDTKDLTKETLESQYSVVKEETNTSTVCQFGAMDISKMVVSNFQGMDKPDGGVGGDPFDPGQCGRDAVSGPEVIKVSLEYQMSPSSDLTDEEKAEAKRQHDELMQGRKNVDHVIGMIVTQVTQGSNELAGAAMGSVPEITDHECYYSAVDSFHELCFDIIETDWAMRNVYVLANLCEMKYTRDVIIGAIHKQCVPTPSIIVE